MSCAAASVSDRDTDMAAASILAGICADVLLGHVTVPLRVGEVCCIDGMDIQVVQQGEDVFCLASVLNHRGKGKRTEFLVLYAGYETEAPTWQPLSNFIDEDEDRCVNSVLLAYCRTHPALKFLL